MNAPNPGLWLRDGPLEEGHVMRFRLFFSALDGDGPGQEIGPDWASAARRRPSRPKRNPRVSRGFVRVSDGTRTRDRLDHNQELYQLSYAHRARSNVAVGGGAPG